MSLRTGVFKYGIRITIDFSIALLKNKEAMVELRGIVIDDYKTYASVDKPHCIVEITTEEIGYLPWVLFELYKVVRNNDGHLYLVGYPPGSSKQLDIIISSNEDMHLSNTVNDALKDLNPFKVSQSTLDELAAFEERQRQEYIEEKEEEERAKITCYATNCPCRSATCLSL